MILKEYWDIGQEVFVEMIDNKKEPLPCIRCSKCAEACPVSLQPQELYWFSLFRVGPEK